MASAPVVSALTVIALSLSACGTGGSSTIGGARTTSGPLHASHSRPTRIYRVRLSGATELSPGAPHGTGAAIIAFHGDSRVCWRFAHLHGFTDATIAGIHSGVHGQSGSTVVALSTGPRLRHQGCARISPALAKQIWSEPSHYNVNVQSKQYPRGAVRAQL